MIRKFKVAALATCIFSAGLLSANPTFAAGRTFVASYGSGNICSLAAPCRLFSEAHAVTDNGGEIVALDSAGYGILTITKSISIIAPAGIHAGVIANNSTGIVIDGAGIEVTLKGLDISGTGNPQNGIDFRQGSKLTVDRCTVRNFRFYNHYAGINATEVIAPASTNPRLVVQNSVIQNNNAGILLSGATADYPIIATISSSTIDGNGLINGAIYHAGVVAYAAAKVSIFNSVISNNFRGLSVGRGNRNTAEYGPADSRATMSVKDSVVNGNVVGLFGTFNQDTSGTKYANYIYFSDSMLTNNTLYTIEAAPEAVIASDGKNIVSGNGDKNNSQDVITFPNSLILK